MDSIDGLVSYLVQIALTLANSLFYPVYKLLEAVYTDIMIIFNAVAGLCWSFYHFADVLYNFIQYFVVSLFPSTWTVIILLGFVLVVSLRVYKFIKDFSFAGFKI